LQLAVAGKMLQMAAANEQSVVKLIDAGASRAWTASPNVAAGAVGRQSRRQSCDRLLVRETDCFCGRPFTAAGRKS